MEPILSPETKEVLVLDSNTFIKEAGLTSGGASALKHYLYYRRTKLVVPRVVAEECERKLTGMVRSGLKNLSTEVE